MGCGASTATEERAPAPLKARHSEEKEREQRRAAVLDKYRCSEKDKNKILAYPLFKIPAAYASDPLHEIAYVFFGVKDESCTEVTVFFRIPKEQDTEIVERQGLNFSMMKDAERTSYSKVTFYHSWGGGESWDTLPNDETHTHTEPYESFQTIQCGRPDDPNTCVARPVLYVNTATHLMGCASTNGEAAELAVVGEYPMYAGTARQAAEILLRAAEAANPDKKEVSPLAQLIPVRTSTKEKRPAPA